MDATKFLENVKQALNIGLVFGESREIGSKTIIPVAHFSYGMGHGEGKAKPGFKIERTDDSSTESPVREVKDEIEEKNSSEKCKKLDNSRAAATGQGFGGGFKAKPVGIFQITEDRTLFIPVISAKQIIMIAITIFWMLKRKKRKRR